MKFFRPNPLKLKILASKCEIKYDNERNNFKMKVRILKISEEFGLLLFDFLQTIFYLFFLALLKFENFYSTPIQIKLKKIYTHKKLNKIKELFLEKYSHLKFNYRVVCILVFTSSMNDS